MRIVILGAAAGGGLPQWNCGCSNCRRARAGDPLVRPRTQCGGALQTSEGWVLLNASPDLRQQILATPDLDPTGSRGSPITDVVLTNGEIDAILGLLTLRESHRFTIQATQTTLDALNGSSLFQSLPPARVPRRSLALDRPLQLASGTVELSLFSVPGKVPLYMETPDRVAVIGAETEDTVGVELLSTGRRAFFIPGCAAMTPVLASRLRGADLVIFDGTLWEDEEMIRLGLGAKTGRRMGHMSMAGEGGSLAAFADLGIHRKVYVHLNNTNPALAEDLAERAAVRAAGWEVAHDGMEIVL